jgi:hypothetical protein
MSAMKNRGSIWLLSSEFHTLWSHSTRPWFVRSWNTSAVYGTHSMTCMWTRLNVCSGSLYHMQSWFGLDGYLWFTTYEHRCALLRLDTLVKRRSIACIMFIFEILSGRMNSPNLLSALDLNTPRYRTRGSDFLRIGFHRTNYGVHEPMSAAMREFNEVIGLFDFILTRNQFVNRLKLTL